MRGEQRSSCIFLSEPIGQSAIVVKKVGLGLVRDGIRMCYNGNEKVNVGKGGSFMEAYWLVHELRWENQSPLWQFVKENKGPVLYCKESLEVANVRQEARLKVVIEKLKKEVTLHGGEWIAFESTAEMTAWFATHRINRLVSSIAHLPKHKKDHIRIRASLPSECEWEENERQLLLPIDRIQTKKRETYHVFTPFYRNFRAVLDHEREGCHLGSFEGEKEWKRFLKDRIHQYQELRDLPAKPGTSAMSKYLRFGEVSPCRLLEDVWKAPMSDGAEAWIRQLIWREFYYRIYEEKPEALIENWNGKAVEWEDNEQGFAAWKAGETGFPVVDAAMRQLAVTGEMHNRIRMIAASFLVKDLHVDWRKGERYFMTQLVDADPYLNNGGWQWIASTGCDAQPYFRVFNPWTQGKRYDPEAEWIKQWVEELRDIPAKEIHKPNGNRGYTYNDAICDHGLESKNAKLYYQKPPAK